MSIPVPIVSLSRYGLYVPPADLYLDARSAPGTVFVSHAHSDHCSDADHILCTPETAAFHRQRRACRNMLEVRFGEEVRLHDTTIALSSAGHALGSAMIHVQTESESVVYTGDFKLRDNPFSPRVVIPRCDTLVMECTFGEPRYVFPPDGELLEELFSFIDSAFAVNATPVVLAYAFGKAQEALYHLTSHGYRVMVHGAIASATQLHVDLGYPFPGPGTWSRYRRGETAGHVLLTVPGTRKTAMVQGIPNKRICHITGWAYHPGAFNIYKGCDLVLPFSDHADWPQLLQMATESGAQKIYTVHGDDTLAKHLQTMGLDAEHLVDHPSFDTLGEDEPSPSRKPRAQLELGL